MRAKRSGNRSPESGAAVEVIKPPMQLNTPGRPTVADVNIVTDSTKLTVNEVADIENGFQRVKPRRHKKFIENNGVCKSDSNET